MERKETPLKSRKGRLLVILPLIVIPLLTLLFWVAGGGGATEGDSAAKKGFNLKLPTSQFSEDKALDKLNYYDQASKDSAQLEEMRKKDPNYRYSDQDSLAGSNQVQYAGGLRMNPAQSPQEEKVYQRLEALQRAISQPPRVQPQTEEYTSSLPYDPSLQRNELSQLMAQMDAPSEPDPEMQQISGMLENILDIQYPVRMEQKIKEASRKNRGLVYSVGTSQDKDVVSIINTGGHAQPNVFGGTTRHSGFYTIDEPRQAQYTNAVQAVVAETQTVVNGSTVKMVLAQDIFINGYKIPLGTYIYGTATLKGERLGLEVISLRHGQSLFPVELTVYDLDGLPGIYIPGAINRDVAKASADRSVQTLGVTTLSDSWGAQAAGAGIEAAKGLFSRKVKLVKVTLKAGYGVLLKDEKQKE